jgi:GxxExxY protein
MMQKAAANQKRKKRNWFICGLRAFHLRPSAVKSRDPTGGIMIMRAAHRTASSEVPRNDPDFFPNAEITSVIIAAFYAVFRALGFGFSEHVYAAAIERELTKRGLTVEREVSVPVYYDGEIVAWQRLDMIVNGCVVIELKTGERMPEAGIAQLLNYLRCTSVEVGMLLYFGPKPGFKRLIVANGRKRINCLP